MKTSARNQFAGTVRTVRSGAVNDEIELEVIGVSKTYASGFRALDRIDLEIRQGEIFALLGPNGAGKTTLIGLVCGIVKLDQGTVSVAGLDIGADYRAVRSGSLRGMGVSPRAGALGPCATRRLT